MTVSSRLSFNLSISERTIHKELSDQSKIILNHRYYLKDENSQPIEDADGLFDRVAWALAKVDKQYGALPVEVELTHKDFYFMMRNLYFLPNSPTLMNAGTEQGTMSACFVLPLNDSMQDIMKTATDMAMVQKFGGGTGFALSQLRPKGSHIKTTHGAACGPIQVLKTLSSVSSMITQGGKRDGANMAVMDIRHPDILEFIRCKSVEGDIHNFNISVGVDSNWMKAVENDMDYDLIDPHTNQVTGQLNAREVFDEIVQGAWRNGEPGMIFLDRVNEDNHVTDQYGKMIATNPCGEQPLLPNESCNLGSINLARFYQHNLRTKNWKLKIIISSNSLSLSVKLFDSSVFSLIIKKNVTVDENYLLSLRMGISLEESGNSDIDNAKMRKEMEEFNQRVNSRLFEISSWEAKELLFSD